MYKNVNLYFLPFIATTKQTLIAVSYVVFFQSYNISKKNNAHKYFSSFVGEQHM